MVHLEVNSQVKDDKIIIELSATKTQTRLKLPFSEAYLLEGLTPETAHADALATLTPDEMVD